MSSRAAFAAAQIRALASYKIVVPAVAELDFLSEEFLRDTSGMSMSSGYWQGYVSRLVGLMSALRNLPDCGNEAQVVGLRGLQSLGRFVHL